MKAPEPEFASRNHVDSSSLESVIRCLLFPGFFLSYPSGRASAAILEMAVSDPGKLGDLSQTVRS
jgi:hypothetical protein